MTQTGTSRHKQACCQMMLCIQVWYWTALSPSQNTAKESGRHHMHHRLMKQTQSKLQIVFNKHCLHMTSTREADRHHLFDAVHEKKKLQSGWPSGASRLSLSPYTSLNEDMEAPAKHPPPCLPLSATLASSSRAAVHWVGTLHHACL